MKKHDLAVLFLLILLIGFSFLSTPNNYVIGQTGSSSSSGDVTSSSSSSGDTVSASSSSSSGDIAASTSSSSGDIVTSTSSTSSTSSSGGTIGIALNPNFTGLWKSKIEKPRGPGPGMATSSSSGEVASSSSSSSSGESAASSSSSSSSGEVASSSSSSSSSGEVTSSSSSGSAARTLFHIDENVRGSSIITFKLCVKDGKLEGTVQQGGVLIEGMITTQTVISSDEIEFTAESRDGKTAMIHLKLTGEREFIGRFADGHEFKGRKLNTLRGECQGPQGSMGGQGMSGLGEPTTSGGPPTMGGPGMSGPSMGGPSMGGPSMGGPGMTGLSDDLGEPTTSGGPSMNGPGMGTMFGGEDQGDNFTSSGGSGMGAPPSMGTLPPGMGGLPSMFGGEDVGE